MVPGTAHRPFPTVLYGFLLYKYRFSAPFVGAVNQSVRQIGIWGCKKGGTGSWLVSRSLGVIGDQLAKNAFAASL